MKTEIEVNKYRLVAEGGETFDKRTWAGKDLVKRIKDTANYNGDINPNFLGLRIKDVKLLFTTDNINLN